MTEPTKTGERERERDLLRLFDRLLDWLYSFPNPRVRWYTQRNPAARANR